MLILVWYCSHFTNYFFEIMKHDCNSCNPLQVFHLEKEDVAVEEEEVVVEVEVVEDLDVVVVAAADVEALAKALVVVAEVEDEEEAGVS